MLYTKLIIFLVVYQYQFYPFILSLLVQIILKKFNNNPQQKAPNQFFKHSSKTFKLYRNCYEKYIKESNSQSLHKDKSIFETINKSYIVVQSDITFTT